MIQVPRSLIRLFRAVVRKAVRRGAHDRPLVAFHGERDALRIRCQFTNVAVEYRQPGSFPAEVVPVPFDALADFEGRGDAQVTLENGAKDTTVARWQEGVVPQVKECEADAGKLPVWPALPATMVPQEPALWKALADATESASQESVRFALMNLQLRGRAGDIIATDGRQLLIQSGFRFPWPDDILIPATPLFGSRELAPEGRFQMGRSDGHVALQLGNWTLQLAIDKDGRYPEAEQVIPSLTGAVTHWRIDPADADFLAQALPKLPCDDAQNAPVTVDLNGQSLVRARDGDQNRITELLLARSGAVDRPVCFGVNRHLLARVLDLDIRDVTIASPEKALVFHDERRKLVVMPLDSKSCYSAGADAVRITSAEEAIVPTNPVPARSTRTMSNHATSPTTNGNGAEHDRDTPATHGQNHGGYSALLAEAEALKTVLRDAFVRSNQLLMSMKKQRKQAQAVQATLSNLRQLQHIDG